MEYTNRFCLLSSSALNIIVTIVLGVILGVFLQYQILTICAIKKIKYSIFLVMHTICLAIFVSINYLLQENIIYDFGMSGTKLF